MTVKHMKKCRQYSIDYLKIEFIASATNQQLPYCFLCNQMFSNESMKPSRMCEHLTKNIKKDKDLNYFQAVQKQFVNRSSIDEFLR